MKETKFFVVTHKMFNQPNIYNYYPIVVGNNNFNIPNAYYDNVNVNISYKNKNFCELTALYWIWKNYNGKGYIALCHYRRYFVNTRFSKNEKSYLTSEKATKIMSRYDIILPTSWGWLNMTVKDWFLNTDGKENDLRELRRVIEKLYPEYISAYDEVFNGYMASYLNMMVISKELMNDYCQWLFDILFELEKRIDISKYTILESRIFGFISERLLNVWVKHRKLKVKYLHVLQTDKPLSQKKILKEDLRRIILKTGTRKLVVKHTK
ncbi:DUF4422 domain-containing protein [Clostridium butyricum]|uniref:DUF4422 domain-containing protein n=1 Tax=Clostridium butyricum TaxID=1492 RepID=UPI000F523927|nr:DUF4422 domain-containing protein [Clostridium butyricum]RQN02449.1 DUF4422 domain-containing protein [Clostridium butyricum]